MNPNPNRLAITKARTWLVLLAGAALPPATQAQFDPIIFSQPWDGSAPAARCGEFPTIPEIDCESADEFCLVADITRVQVIGYFGGCGTQNPAMHLRFYGQGPGGKPGALLQHYFFPAEDPRVISAGTGFIFDLVSQPFHANGRTFISLQTVGCEFDVYGSNAGHPAGQSFYWRNPGGGWGMGHSDWGPLDNSDLAFTLRGTLNGTPDCTIPPPEPPADIEWHAADNPHIVNGTFSIVPNQTLTIEPGVHVQINPDSSIVIEGTVTGQGTPDGVITFDSATNLYANGIKILNSGTLNLAYADMNSPVTFGGVIGALGDSQFDHCNFFNFSAAMIGGYTQFTNCDFDGVNVHGGSRTTVRMQNVTSNTPLDLNASYCLLDNVSIDIPPDPDGLPLSGALTVAGGLQPLYVDHVTARNPSGTGIRVGFGSVCLGPNNIMQGNLYATSASGGYMPGSVVPATGNTNAYVPVSPSGFSVWSPLSLPYVTGGGFLTSSFVDVLPGATVKFTPNGFFIADVSGLRARGLPEAPITFERFDPAQAWSVFHMSTIGMRFDYCHIDGSEFGILGDQVLVDVHNCLMTNNQQAGTRGVRARGTTFANNAVGVTSINSGFGSATPNVNGIGNPNSFVGNGIAVQEANGCTTIDATGNWWNSPSGPSTPLNPGGTGDSIAGCVAFAPFAVTDPGVANSPPIVRIQVPANLEPGSRTTIAWTARDDGAIVSQRIYFSPHSNVNFTLVAGNLPGGQRAFEWTVPQIGLQTSGSLSYVRVVAVDELGLEDWDDHSVLIASGDVPGNLQFTNDLGGRTLQFGQIVPVTWNAGGFNGGTNLNAYLVGDADGAFEPLGAGNVEDGHLFSDPILPTISTDTARIAVVVTDSPGLNRQKWFYTPYFAIRPDLRLGDTPPSVAMTSPSSGQTFVAGSVIPIRWTASDNEIVRAIHVFASFDGINWTPIAKDLPGTETSLSWRCAAGAGFANVRIRVIAVDLRYQNSSVERVICIATRNSPGDMNCDGSLNLLDIDPFVAALGDPARYARDFPSCNRLNADTNSDGSVNLFDIQAFVDRLTR